MLVEQLQEVLVRAVLKDWLGEHPQTSAAEAALFEKLRSRGLVAMPFDAPEFAQP